MPIVDLFSSRQKKDQPPGDVWEYGNIPHVLRMQVSNIVEGAFGPVRDHGYSSGGLYKLVCDTVAHEHGREKLSQGLDERPRAQVLACIRSEQDLLVWLDAVEVALRLIETYQGRIGEHDRRMKGIEIAAQDAVSELNERFRRAGFGYRYEGSKIIRIDSELLHQEVTRPALSLLSDSRFAGADQEFRAAHDHLKAGEFRDCTVDALNALESTMKAICDAKGWEYNKGSRASDLVKVLRENGLFPEFAERSFDQLISTLNSGLPTVRNVTGGHGQGAKTVETPEYVATYALNLAATKIRLLYEAFRATEK
jgi:AbiJ N-terminal domain 4